MFSTRTRGRKKALASFVAIAVSSALVLTGCSTGDSPAASTPPPTADAEQARAIEAALQVDTTLTFWGWAPQQQSLVNAFMKAYPKVKVELQNNGSAATEYSKLQNVITAGSGVPDVAQLEYTALPQFVFSKSLANMSEYGLDSLAPKFSPAPWAGVNVDGGVYGMPQDGGPIVMFYRQDIFDKLGLTVPTTWDEYIEVGKAIKKANPDMFITTDVGQASAAESLIWAAGGRPFKVDGTDVTVNLQDKGSKKWAKTREELFQDELIDSIPTFSPEWSAAMAAGTYATWISGSWGAGSLQKRFPQDAGKWRVAPLPQYSKDSYVTGIQGGSSTAVMDASPNKLAALGFAKWISTAATANGIFADEGGFPTAMATLDSPDWSEKEVPFFGGQQANKVFADSYAAVGKGWQFPPYHVYADTLFADTVGQEYKPGGDINAGLKDWQDAIVSYGNQQGFSVNK